MFQIDLAGGDTGNTGNGKLGAKHIRIAYL